MTWRTLAAGGFALALLLGGGDPGEAQSKKRLAMGCAPSTVSHYPYCVGQARAINAGVPDVDVTVVETGASVDNLKRMQKNTIDYGLTTNEQVALAHKGDGVWKPTPFPEIRNLWYYSVSAVYVIVREDTGVKSIDELAGKKFAAGFRGSATEKMTEASLTHLGVKAEWFRGGNSDLVDAMKDKRLVGMAKGADAFRLDPSTMDIATSTPIRILPWTDEHVRKVKSEFPHYPWVRVPAGSIKGMGEFWSQAIVLGFSAPASMPVDLAYRIVKAVLEDREHQRGAFKGIVDDMGKATLDYSLSPLHAGAVKYFREKGVKIPAHLIPPEAK